MKNIGQDCCSVASCNTIFVDQQKNAATKAKLAPLFFLQIAIGQVYMCVNNYCIIYVLSVFGGELVRLTR